MRANFVSPPKDFVGQGREPESKFSSNKIMPRELGVWHEQNFLVDLGGDGVFAFGGGRQRASGHLQPAGLGNGHFRSDRPGSYGNGGERGNRGKPRDNNERGGSLPFQLPSARPL